MTEGNEGEETRNRRKRRRGRKPHGMKEARPLGRDVRKRFLGYGVFSGKVVSYNPDSGLYGIEYEDGEYEELDELKVRMKAHDEAESIAVVNAEIQALIPRKSKEGHCERTPESRPDGERVGVYTVSEVEMGIGTENLGESAQLSKKIDSVQAWTKRDVAKFIQELWDMDEDKTKAKKYAANMQAQDIDGEGANQVAVSKVD